MIAVIVAVIALYAGKKSEEKHLVVQEQAEENDVERTEQHVSEISEKENIACMKEESGKDKFEADNRHMIIGYPEDYEYSPTIVY